MRKVLIGLMFIFTPAILMALAKLIIDPLFLSQKVVLGEVQTLFAYGLVVGLGLLVLRLVISKGQLP